MTGWRPTRRAVVAMALAATTAVSVGNSNAHHSQAPFFDQSRDVAIEGVVQRFDFRNPHAILYVEVPADDGTTALWELQFASVTILVRAGLSSTTFAQGERIRAVGHPARNPDARGLASVAVTKADGTEIVDPLRSGAFDGGLQPR